MKKKLQRCEWPKDDALMQAYHDHEWGIPVHDDTKHFEFLILDAFQAGLSWKTILHRREGFRKAFVNFDVKKVAKFNDKHVEKLMQDVGIIRNRLKITGTIKNAKAFIVIQKEFGSFDKYIWQFTKNKIIEGKRKTIKDIPATSKESDTMSIDRKSVV